MRSEPEYASRLEECWACGRAIRTKRTRWSKERKFYPHYENVETKVMCRAVWSHADRIDGRKEGRVL